MPIFVHLTSHRNAPGIRRDGISMRKGRLRPRGVYSMPVTLDFYAAHQWLRELKRQGGGTIVGIYFRVPDDEPVELGHYNSLHVSMTASEAVKVMLDAEKRNPVEARGRDKKSRRVRQRRELPSAPEGYEVIIPRRIEASEITRVKSLPQVVGWRYQPGANKTRPCVCICCQRGEYGVGKLRRRVEEAEARDAPSKVVMFGRGDSSFRRVARLRRNRESGKLE